MRIKNEALLAICVLCFAVTCDAAEVVQVFTSNTSRLVKGQHGTHRIKAMNTTGTGWCLGKIGTDRYGRGRWVYITNNHMAGNRGMFLGLHGEGKRGWVKARVLGKSYKPKEHIDLALVEVRSRKRHQAFRLARRYNGRGTKVTWVGYAKGRRAPVRKATIVSRNSFDKLSIPGDSGAPVIDRNGHVQGVIWGYDDDNVQGKCVFTNSNQIRKFVQVTLRKISHAQSPIGMQPPLEGPESPYYIPVGDSPSYESDDAMMDSTPYVPRSKRKARGLRRYIKTVGKFRRAGLFESAIDGDLYAESIGQGMNSQGRGGDYDPNCPECNPGAAGGCGGGPMDQDSFGHGYGPMTQDNAGYDSSCPECNVGCGGQ